jgi:hypothetical protein
MHAKEGFIALAVAVFVMPTMLQMLIPDQCRNKFPGAVLEEAAAEEMRMRIVLPRGCNFAL